MCPGRTAVVQQLWRRDVTSPLDVRLHALSFYTRTAGGVRVAKHARQLSLACFVNTRR